jgi:hypothetical protein
VEGGGITLLANVVKPQDVKRCIHLIASPGGIGDEDVIASPRNIRCLVPAYDLGTA